MVWALFCLVTEKDSLSPTKTCSKTTATFLPLVNARTIPTKRRTSPLKVSHLSYSSKLYSGNTRGKLHVLGRSECYVIHI